MSLLAYTKTCGVNRGGGVNLYLILASDFTSATLDSGATYYDTITLPTGKNFVEFDFQENTLQYTPVMEGVNGASKITHTIVFNMGRLDQTARDAAQALIETGDCGIIALLKNANDEVILIGYDEKDGKNRPLYVASANGDSKLELNEAGELVVTLATLGNREFARKYTGTIPTA